jgi:hypothetical protein
MQSKLCNTDSKYIIMKKTVLFNLFLMSSLGILAQSPGDYFQNNSSAKADKKKKTGPGIMLHGGFNFSGIGGESESYIGSLPGAYLGAGFNVIKISKAITLNASIAFSQEGSKYEAYQYIPGGEGATKENKVRLNYLRFPLLARLESKKGLYGEAGIRPGLLLSAKDKYDGQTDDLKDDYNKFDMGLSFSAGYRFGKHAGAHIRFAPGITNINKKGGPNDAKKDRNRSISLGVDWWF